MYGRYSKDLGEYVKSEARKLKMLEQRRKKEDRARNRVRNKHFIKGAQYSLIANISNLTGIIR